jgi:allantoinase
VPVEEVLLPEHAAVTQVHDREVRVAPDLNAPLAQHPETPGGQSTLNVLLTEGEKRGLDLPALASVTSGTAARRFGLSGKGRIEVGYDADLAVVDLDHRGVLRAEDLFYRHRFSPYVGRELKGRVVQTLVRGRPVFCEGKVVSEPVGRLVRPERAPAGLRAAGS